MMNLRILLGLVTLSFAYGLFVDDLLDGYEFRKSPKAGSGVMDIKIGYYINSISLDAVPPSGTPVTATFLLYLRQGWQDERLAFPEGQEQQIMVDPSDIGKVWRPDTFFRKAIAVQRIDEPNAQKLLRIKPSGEIWSVETLKLTVPCTVSIERPAPAFITCSIFAESYAFTIDSLSYAWLDRHVEMETTLDLADYNMIDLDIFDCSQNYTAGAFPCLAAKFSFQET